jgi:Fe-S-cluster containining protein
MPRSYRCQRCTACCRWPGEVHLGNEEVSRLAAFLGMPEYRFVQDHMRLGGDGGRLVLIDKPNGHCIFLEGRDCRVQPVKPDQCREFPNRGRFPGFERLCQAIPEPRESDHGS